MVLCFGPHTLDAAQRLLFTDGRPVHLTPKAFDLLQLLVDRRPGVLGKDEILGAVWPATFVSENNLATLVRDLRAALGDDADRPRYIRTAFGVGYAFIGEVIEAPASGAPPRSSWRLVLDAGELPLAEGANVIGRTGPGAIVIDAPTISRRHARLEVNGAQVQCEDLGSKNGTWVGTERLHGPRSLQNGDQVRFGSVLATLRRDSARVSTQTHERPTPR